MSTTYGCDEALLSFCRDLTSASPSYVPQLSSHIECPDPPDADLYEANSVPCYGDEIVPIDEDVIVNFSCPEG